MTETVATPEESAKTLEQETKETTLTAEETADVFDDDDAPREILSTEEDEDPLDKIPSPTKPPDWAIIPKDIKFPPPGCQIAFVRIPAAWTRDPSKGERQCILWGLDEQDEAQAYNRGRGDQMRAVTELAKGTVRVIDGHLADWTGKNKLAEPNRFFRDIGPKGRQAIRNYYVQTHNLTKEDAADFFSNHFAVVTVQRA